MPAPLPVDRRPTSSGPVPDPTRPPRRAADWRDLAACVGQDPELFFPLGSSGPGALQIEDAKRVCQRCVARQPCLAWSLQNGMEHGVWGGLTDTERNALRRRAARRPTP